MASRLNEICVDCVDPEWMAEFWCAALGWVVTDTEPGLVEIAASAVSDEQRLADFRAGPVIPTIIFIATGDAKAGKNRLHLDLSPIDCTHEAEVERVLALGATRAEVGQSGDESWTVLADPEGSEFCVLRSLAEGQFAL